ncbi:Calx-beta domain-containing protein, partial [Marinilabilia sp.]
DDGVPTVAISASPTSFSENGGSSTITATLSGVASQPITVTIGAVNGTASGADYVLSSTEITIAAGALTGTTSITGSDDEISEGSETLSIDITAVSAGATEDGTQTQPLTITDDDGVPTVSISASPTSFSENESTTITAELSNPAKANISVTLQTTNISAESGDYALGSSTITIIGGELSGTTTLSGVSDNIYEGNETLDIALLEVSGGSASIGTPSSVSLTITDLQSPPTVTLSANPTTIGEDGISTITAQADVASEQAISVTLLVNDESTEPEDYNITSLSISIPNLSSEGSTTLEGVPDEIYEGDETVSISIDEVSGASAQAGTPQSVTITISDDQSAPTVTLSASPLSINEGENSTLTATLNTAASEDVTITLMVTNIDTDANDYSLSSTSIIVPGGNLSGTVTLSTSSDGLFEGDESLEISISEVSGGSASTGTPASVSLTIADNETAPVVSLSATPLSLDEGGNATITATLNTATNQDVNITLNIQNQTAGSEDYVLSSENITIPSGNLSASVNLEAVDDAVFENNESLIIEITDVTGGSATEDGDQTVSITLLDNESAPLVSLSASPINIQEDGSSTLTATLSTATYETITITVSPTTGGIENADYTLSSNTISIPAGELSGTLTVQGIADNIFEGNETFDFEITTVSGGGGTEDGNQLATIILNDDELPPVVSLSASPISIAEDGSSTLTVSLSNPTYENVLVNLSITGGSATTNDYNLSSGSVIIPAGSESAITILDGLPDALYEGDESVTVEISAVGGGSATENGTQSVSVTIEDAQDIPSASLELSGSPFSEDEGIAYLTVRLNHASVQNVQIGLLFGGTASVDDYSGSTSSVEISAGTTEITIPLSGDNDAEAEGEETITVSIESVTNGIEDGDQSVTATILDDDVVGIKPGITGAGTTTSETGTFDNFNVMLNTQPASDVVIEITGLDTSEGSVSPASLTFTPSNWNENQIVTITGVDDNEVDGDITYTLTLEVVNNNSDPAYHNVSTTVDVTNTDNDAAGFTLSITNSDTRTSESGDSDVFSLVLTSQPTSDVVLIVSGLDPTEGSISTEEVTFTAANWNQLQNITITGVDDDLVDGNITYMLTISVDDSRSDATYHGQSETLNVINTDDDSAGISVIISGDNTQTSESGTTDSFDVALSSQPESDVVIVVSGVDESEAVVSSNQLTFTSSNWNQSQTISVSGMDDNMVDGNITFTLSLTVDNSLSDSEYHDQSVNVEVTNTDDDSAGISINESGGTTITSEAGGTDSFEVSLTSQPQSYVFINILGLETSEGSLSPDELIFSPDEWNQPQTVTVTGIDDDLMDGDISYTLNLSVDYDNSDDTYDGLSESVLVVNIDDETENLAPEPVSDEFTVDENILLQGSSLLSNDTDPDGDAISINTTPVTPPANGILEIFENGTFTYQPDAGFTGEDSFEYEVCDNRSPLLCATAIVTITVLEVDPDPDNDGIPTEEEGDGDADNDGIPNYLDTDSDNDGIPDAEENAFDCDNDGITDRLDPDPCFKVKEAFSPNNDGINDGFVIPWTSQYDKVSLIIFNRWGSVVYSADDYQNDWKGEASSGISKGKGLPAGTYYYIVTIHDINKKISGYFYLNR